MLHYVRQLVSMCVLLGGGQAVYSGFYSFAAAAKNNAMRAMRVNRNNEVAGWKTKNTNSKML